MVEKKRHIAKAITWRIVGTIDTFALGWIISGDISIGAAIGGLELVTKMFLYYIHERIWYKTKFGIRKIKNKNSCKNIS